MQYRYDKWADPATGEIDYRNYYKALAQADRIAQGLSKANYDLTWDALGPDNQGGRTRAILIDKDDRNLMSLIIVDIVLNRGTMGIHDNYPGFSAISRSFNLRMEQSCRNWRVLFLPIPNGSVSTCCAG